MTTPPRRLVWALAVLVVVAVLLPIALKQLVWATPQHWQVDLSVYRAAGQSVLDGRPVYDYLAPPQFLPFTYPPISAALAVPLAMVPFTLAGWGWFLLQAAADAVIAAYAVRPLASRSGRWAPLVYAAAAGVSFHLLPVSDGLRFGQVDAFLVLAVLVDLHRPTWWRRVPAGVLIGLATAIKLTPGMFIVHLLVSGRRRQAWQAIATAVGATLVGIVALPRTSFAYWAGALLDSSRLGPNDGTSNQSLRGMLLRLGPGGAAGSALWLALVAVVLVVGLWLARRAYLGPIRSSARFVRVYRRVGRTNRALDESAGDGEPRRGEPGRGNVCLQVALIGMVTVLVSPVSWIHHFDWIVLVIGALLGSGRDRRRLAAAAAVTIVFLLDLPWWGQWTLVPTGRPFPADSNGNVWGVLMNNSLGIMALVCIGLLAWSMHRSSRRAPS